MIQLVKTHSTSQLQVISHSNLESIAGKALGILGGSARDYVKGYVTGNPHNTAPGYDHIFIRLAPAPPMPPLPNVHVCNYMGTLPCWEPMWPYSVKIIIIQVDIILIIPKFINEVPSHAKGA